ncbi:Ras family Rab small GTP-binding protein [Theileria equi strain WA]|uniref:Ras family Rab small GTP-binding protein n=1 Tax=Theileria equi strain WA TaxID=1537102 RepID=L0AW95_THEEQ|nr:Ras family Rab small GTP-binding protein [Theileria equi strain WA]AFZ79508.1 Ras family Rab small GTP-binding protein [Theileria equi strain WA]|eukprot:XP_004829174.1 Ras family Rab small GTP-binding protein [Theileria equi strain WA]
MAQEDYDHVYKIILLGDATVGKSHMLCQYIKGTVPSQSKATIGVEFATRTVPLASGGTVKAQIWDTAGQERYRSITSAHYRRAVGALLVYDITNRQSFHNCRKWLKELRNAADDDIIITLVGNKVDLVERDESLRQVHVEQAAKFASENNLTFYEASAVTSYNVKRIFEHLLQDVHDVKSRVDPEVEDKVEYIHNLSRNNDIGCLDRGLCNSVSGCITQ